MIPIHQTILADPARNDGHDAEGRPGNCYQAALASALELPLEEVPHFATFTEDWAEQSWDWLRQQGMARTFYFGDALGTLGGPLCVAAATEYYGGQGCRAGGALRRGASPRGPFRHVVVLDLETGEMQHDPHPSGAGLVEVDEVEIIFGAVQS